MPFDQEGYFASPQVTQPVTDDVLRHLIEARALIADKRRWCVGSRINEHGQRCALGALDAMLGGYCSAIHQPEVRLLARFSDYKIGDVHPVFGPVRHAATQVAHHNNDKGHAATLEMFDRAIAARASELAQTS